MTSDAGGDDAPASDGRPPGATAPRPGGPPRATAPPGPGATAAATAEAERRLHPAWIIARSVSVLRGLVPALVGLAVGLRGWALPAALVLVAAVVLVRTAEWRTTRYTVVDGGLRVRRGILRRKERVVPASRISALDTSRGLVQRAFGLVSLEVQTAGGGREAELRLDALSAEEAERLRAALGHREAPSPDSPTAGPPAPAPPGTAGPGASAAPAPVYAISGRMLVIAALTGPQLTLVAVVVGSFLSQAGELLPDAVTDRVEELLSGADAATIAALVLVGVLLAGAASVVGSVLAFAEFAILRDDRRLRVRRGLLTERTATIPLDRIQGVRIVEGLLRRPLGYATVQIEIAGYRGDDEVTRTLVPLVARRDLPELLARMLPELPWPAELHPPPARSRRAYRAGPLLVAAVPALAAAALLPGAWRAAALLPLGAACLLGDARRRGAGWSLGPEVLAVRSQLLARTTLLAIARRVQRAELGTTPLQRRAGLATFGVRLATRRRARVLHLETATADGLQRAVAARTGRDPPPAVHRELPLDFAAAPPE